MKRFEVWREADARRSGMRIIEVSDDQGPRDAALDYVEQTEAGEAVHVLVVRRVNGSIQDHTNTTTWRVEPVTTYRARPA